MKVFEGNVQAFRDEVLSKMDWEALQTTYSDYDEDWATAFFDAKGGEDETLNSYWQSVSSDEKQKIIDKMFECKEFCDFYDKHKDE